MPRRRLQVLRHQVGQGGEEGDRARARRVRGGVREGGAVQGVDVRAADDGDRGEAPQVRQVLLEGQADQVEVQPLLRLELQEHGARVLCSTKKVRAAGYNY